MDHLLRPAGSHPPLEFEYHETATWLNKPTEFGLWSIYPRGEKWNLDPLRFSPRPFPLILKGRNIHQLFVFLQSWLFFGPLAICIQHTDSASFTKTSKDGARVLDTSSLLPRCESWAESTIREYEGSNRNWKAEYQTRVDTLRFVEDIISHFHEHGATLPEPEAAAISKIGLSTGLLIRVLCQATSHVWQSVNSDLPFDPLDVQGFEGEVRGSLLEDRLFENGWCPTDSRRLFVSGGIEAVSVASFISRLQSGSTTHSRCNEAECVAYNIPKGTYEPKHSSKCRGSGVCNASGISLGSAEDILLETSSFPIIRGNLPSSSDANDQCRNLQAVRHKQGIEYIAISHVWSDGLGDELGNRLRECQLEKISGILRDTWTTFKGRIGSATDLGPEQTEWTPYFWLDTLCVPHAKKARKAACARMASSYEDASLVLVLDAELQDWHYYPDKCDAEALLRIVSSTWAKRVWTLSEGVLGKKLVFRFADFLFDLDMAGDRIIARLLDPRARLRTLERQLFLSMKQMRDVKKLEPSDRFADGYSMSKGRWTSHRGDDIIALAVLVGSRHIQALLDIEVNDTDGWNERWMEFLRTMHHLPHSVLFYSGPRLATPGFRWAPGSMGLPGGLFKLDWDKAHIDSVRGGLVVRSPGLVLEGDWKKIHNTNPDTGYFDAVFRPTEGDDSPWYKVACSDSWHVPRNRQVLAKQAIKAAFHTKLAVVISAQGLDLIPPVATGILLSNTVRDKDSNFISGEYLAKVEVETMYVDVDTDMIYLMGPIRRWSIGSQDIGTIGFYQALDTQQSWLVQ